MDTTTADTSKSPEANNTVQTENSTDAILSSPALPAEDTLSDAMPSSATVASEDDLPDWLKPPLPTLDTESLPEVDTITEAAVETSSTETASVSSDPLIFQADAIQADNASVGTLSEYTTDDALPDWLDALQQDAASAAQAAENITAPSVDTPTNTPAEDLPSWLIDSAQDMGIPVQTESSIGTPDPLVETTESTKANTPE